MNGYIKKMASFYNNPWDSTWDDVVNTLTKKDIASDHIWKLIVSYRESKKLLLANLMKYESMISNEAAFQRRNIKRKEFLQKIEEAKQNLVNFDAGEGG